MKLNIELIREELEKNNYGVGVIPPNVIVGQKLYKNYRLLTVWYCKSGRFEWRIDNPKTKKIILKQEPISIENKEISFEIKRASASFKYHTINF